MKTFIIKLTLFILIGSHTFLTAQIQELNGYILDNKNNPLEAVNISIANTTGTTTDSTGFFRLSLKPGNYTLFISSMGYKNVFFPVSITPNRKAPVQIKMYPSILEQKDAIIIYGDYTLDPLDANRDKWLNSTDDILKRFAGVEMMQRANFATEPTIRGSSAGQIGVTIDGMKIFHACVDRMDPVSAYVEVENLESLELSKGSFDLSNQQTIGGSLNFVTQKANYKSPFYINMESGFESVSRLKRMRGKLNFSSGLWALRVSASLKKSSDYYAGDGRQIYNSGYSKNNYALNLSRKIGETSSLKFNYIGDNAWDIGYPALIMDATKTKSHIASIDFNKTDISKHWNSLSTKIYYTRVEHWMDDYARSEEEIKKREIMPNMYMPMFGKSETMGLILKSTLMISDNQILKLTTDYYRLAAFADMKMYALDNAIAPAYLVNIPRIYTNNYALTADHQWFLSQNTRLRTNFRLDYSTRTLDDEFGKRLLNAYWNKSNLDKNYFIGGISANIERILDAYNTFNLKLASSQRLPTHMENYGYLLFNVLDGYFYTGSPNLQPEHSLQIETDWKFNSSKFNSKTSIYFSRINNYINGKLLDDEFKVYANFDHVYISGIENSFAIKLNRRLNLNNTFSYTFGYNPVLDEHLPYIPPFSGNFSLSWQADNYWLEAATRYAASQNNIAQKTTREDVTPGFVLFNIRSRIKFFTNWELKLGIENILDKKYHDHLSINNLPGRGRNIYAGISFNYSDL